MPRSKSRGKKYSPKPISANSMEWAMAGAHLLPAEKRSAIYDPVNAAYQELRRGAASTENWYTLCNALNLSEALMELNIGNNLSPQILEGREALKAVGERLRASGVSTCHAAELMQIREATELFNIQLGLCSQAEMSKAVRRVNNVINGGGVSRTTMIEAAA